MEEITYKNLYMLSKTNYNYVYANLYRDYKIYKEFKEEIIINENYARLDQFLEFLHTNKSKVIQNIEPILKNFRHCRGIDKNIANYVEFYEDLNAEVEINLNVEYNEIV